MAFFSDLFGGGDYQDPAAAAAPYHAQIPGVGKEYYNPFIKSGQEAEQIANPIYGQMSQDPNAFLDNIMRGYTPSEGYRFKERYLQQNAHNTAAAGGFAGTENDVLGRNEMVRGSLGQDMQEFLANILGIQNQGLQGQENRVNRGWYGSDALAKLLSGNLESQASLAYQGAHGQNVNNQIERGQNMSLFSNLIGSAAQAYTGMPRPGG
jgi:hypothetical protein